MADNNPNPDDAPEGFWDDFSAWATKEGNKQAVMDAFFASKQAPAPTPNDDGKKDDDGDGDGKKPRKGWFGV